MRRRLPSLIALRVFECAARHESFTRAADELCVTQAAVSHQIKALEEWLGVLLFKRLNRSIKLTVVGAKLGPELTASLDMMADATAAALSGETGNVVRVAALSSFVANWIVPRVSGFRDFCPDTQLRFLAKRQEDDALASGDADIEIRYGEGGWTGVVAIEFLREDIFPVISPSLLDRHSPVSSLSDLAQFDLLHDVLSVDWKLFLDEFGVTDVDADKGMGFTESHLVNQTCVEGNGVALGRGALVESALARGELTRPWVESLPSPFSYYLVFRDDQREDPTVRGFAAWLSEETGSELTW